MSIRCGPALSRNLGDHAGPMGATPIASGLKQAALARDGGSHRGAGSGAQSGGFASEATTDRYTLLHAMLHTAQHMTPITN